MKGDCDEEFKLFSVQKRVKKKSIWWTLLCGLENIGRFSAAVSILIGASTTIKCSNHVVIDS